MPIIIPFSHLPGLERTGVLAPMVPVTFINDSNECPTFALVDSGAERGLISTVIANSLGIEWNKLPKKTGFTTASTFTFRIFRDLKVNVHGHEFIMDMNIVDGISAFKCILGRKDLLRRAKITFECYKNQFQIDFRKYN
ncbi:retropepsin-like domain-containing protein [Patescibacteria group bacterium]|nr:retropepsin-like domain-containing protein [Patescibacteria group bacterium]MBU1472687.1 retropepsin-like domain-containing protein [Patescibacteria group bacterium]MBU2460132.1 retropepsin-like domain-containing protein [Patescibacteria group bacterium]MBU2544387.1 retropepsin-like domain-containing protein [Patescibacteria group bacterium]